MEGRFQKFCNRGNVAELDQNVWFCFPTFLPDRSGDKRGSLGKYRSNDTSDTHMEHTIRYKFILKMSIQHPLLLPVLSNPLLNLLGEKHPIVKTRSLRLLVWKITGKPWKWKEFQAMQPTLSQIPGDQVQLQVVNQPVTSELAGAVDNKLI